ncbi:hypothetical protein E7Z59_07075 [Robertkochia marina]|uniref:Uncharacterized protein n=1 Tax=Robertkochia marina TaxID=1227945 RepID=A0A4S3M055_9FLAO|nr:hypothetical protein [Robertkochia marina]THD67417.1 hypothetical protein E7Z59_07075 [Robertkochia marina]TRZ40796.1 hypothetical protein D3A96_15270 [Robertkochia marina]
MSQNFSIKHQEHFKLYVLLKDKIIFENELEKNGIKFYQDSKEQPYIDKGIRYFLADKDREIIDSILIENKIVASTESIPGYDYNDQSKVLKMFIWVLTGIIFLIILLSLIMN